MKTNNEAMMGLIKTLIRFGIMKKPIDFPFYLVWSRDVGRYSQTYGYKNETELG